MMRNLPLPLKLAAADLVMVFSAACGRTMQTDPRSLTLGASQPPAHVDAINTKSQDTEPCDPSMKVKWTPLPLLTWRICR